MRVRDRIRRRSIVPIMGIALGIGAGIASVALSSATAGRTSADPPTVFDATHLPPLLTTAGERVDLTYDVHCATSDAETPCDVRGAVFVRAVGEESFASVPLEIRSLDGRRELTARVPDAVARSPRAFEYYAVLEASELEARITVPAGGDAAPHVSRPLGASVDVALGRHAFRVDRRPPTRVAAASWGDGAADVGLEQARNLAPIGASAFDVDSHGEVVLLDQAHRRLLRWRQGANVPVRVPVSVNGTLADLAVADDGSIFVLETTGPPGRNPLVRRFDDAGRELEAIETAEPVGAQLGIDDRGPVVLGRPSHHWMPVMVDGTPTPPAEQLRHGRPSRRLTGGRELVLLRRGREIRVALLAGQRVARSWRLTSDTPVAEVQLAEPMGRYVVLVARMYEDDADEFAVLILGRNGLVDRFALDSSDWAEAAPLGRFRLVGRSLYRLGSTPAGVFVDRFDLEVH